MRLHTTVKGIALSVKRIVLVSVLFFSFYFLFFVSPAFAQASAEQTYLDSTEPTQSQTQSQYLTPNTDPDVPRNLGTFTQSAMIEVVRSMICQLSGIDVARNVGCIGIDPLSGQLGFTDNNNGAIGAFSKMIVALYVPPLHTNDYIKYLSNNFGFPKPTYAQAGIGFTGLKPILSTWVVFRNMVYLVFVIVFIVIGVAIMLRVHIDPRTVMTIQNQIPKIIMALVLVTFSFAIAGLLIDLMWISVYLVVSLLGSGTTIASNSSTLYNNPLGFTESIHQPGGILGIVKGASDSIGAMLNSLFTDSIFIPQEQADHCAGGIPLLCNVQDLWDNTFVSIVNGALGLIVSFIGGILAFLILLIAIIWALLRLWFALLKAYISILLDVIFAPLWIIIGLYPGASVSFTSWIRDMLGNLMAFPAVIGLFLIGKIIMDEFSIKPADYTGQFIPPLIANPGVQSTLGPLIGIGIILASPHVVEATKKAFKATGIGFGPIGQSLGAGQAFVGGVGGAIWSRMYYRDPRTGQTHGPAAEIGRGAGRRLGATRPVQAVRNSRLFNNPASRFVGGMRGLGQAQGVDLTNRLGSINRRRRARAAAQAMMRGARNNQGGGGGQGGGTPPQTPPQAPPAAPPPAGGGPQAGTQQPNYPANEDAQN